MTIWIPGHVKGHIVEMPTDDIDTWITVKGTQSPKELVKGNLEFNGRTPTDKTEITKNKALYESKYKITLDV